MQAVTDSTNASAIGALPLLQSLELVNSKRLDDTALRMLSALSGEEQIA